MGEYHQNLLHWIMWAVVIPYVAVAVLVKAVLRLWWIPRRIEKYYSKQGILGPKYHLLLGNLKEVAELNLMAANQPMNFSHNVLPRVLAFYHHWKKLYGSKFIIWFGTTARLTISEPGLIREIFILKSEYFEKIESPPLVREIEGDGLLNLEGDTWAHHRRIIQPTFHLENLKLMTETMGKSMEGSLAKWSSEISNAGRVEVEVSSWFEEIAEDAVTRATFGSRSFEAGKAIYKLQAQQMAHAAKAYQTVFIPGYRYLPTKKNRISWSLDKEVRKSLTKVIDQRIKSYNHQEPSDECPSDLMELVIKAHLKHVADESSSTPTVTANDVVEECKSVLFAGKLTTANLLTWTTVLLAMHPQWQEQAREEVLRVCGSRDTPAKEDFTKLKMLGMILNESLRLYPPAVAMVRRAATTVEIGDVEVEGGTEILIPILAVHHDPSLWCHDVHEFNPGRFAKGVAHAAKHPMAFMPFGMGARRCVGQNLAILQAKLAMAMILQRFTFELGPTYKHAPGLQMHLYPQYGAPIVFRKL